MTMRRKLSIVATSVLVAGCASTQRSCSGYNATTFGADWIVVQFAQNGDPFNCWQLHGVSIAQDSQGSEGVNWLDTATGHLVHISGWYNRVQVTSGNFAQAATLLGVDAAKCGDGHYPKAGGP